jgi:hypothetical protein
MAASEPGEPFAFCFLAAGKLEQRSRSRQSNKRLRDPAPREAPRAQSKEWYRYSIINIRAPQKPPFIICLLWLARTETSEKVEIVGRFFSRLFGFLFCFLRCARAGVRRSVSGARQGSEAIKPILFDVKIVVRFDPVTGFLLLKSKIEVFSFVQSGSTFG